MARDYDINEPRDWTGYWILEAERAAGLPETTVFVKADFNNNRLLSALQDAMLNWSDWLVAEQLPNEWLRNVSSRSLRSRMTKDWYDMLAERLASLDDDERVQLDTWPGAT